ncbi:hypothetical protein LT330_008016 [Penicillium expansum]|nr:hypothetical protein LT330_008016 [Penicillium expansum]
MPTNFPTFTLRSRQRAAETLQARNQLIINPTSYEFLGIDCRLLELDDDGKHLHPPSSDPSAPTFFEPRGGSWVAPVVPNLKHGNRLRAFTEGWKSIQEHLLVQDLYAQASHVSSGLEWMFFQFRRQSYPPGDARVPPNLRQLSKWLESGDIVPSVFASRFYAAIWGSIRWSPGNLFVPKTLLYPLGVPPHIMITILIGEEPSEELFREEIMTLTAAMITRLEGEEFLECNIIPVMAITIFGHMKARVIEANSSHQGLMIKKSQLFDFSTNELANKSMNILLGFMCADLVGDPREPILPTNIVESPQEADKVEKLKGGTLRKMFGERCPQVGPDAVSDFPIGAGG